MLAVAIVVGGAGCSTKSFKPSKIFSMDSTWPFDGDEGPEEGIPVRMVGAWTDTVMTKPGEKPQRGFGGRVMFYGEEGEEPIIVDGQLVVYAFDETGRAPTDNKPTRRYVFPPETIKQHMSKSDIGASYSFWLPWDEVGGQKTEVSLICRFEPKGGPIVTGEQTRHMLPGTMPGEAVASSVPKVPEGVPMRPAQMTLEDLQQQQLRQSQALYQQQQMHPGVQPAGYVAPVAAPVTPAATPVIPGAMIPPSSDAAQPNRQMTVTSINLPPSFQMPPPSPVGAPVQSPPSPIATPHHAVQPVQQAVYHQATTPPMSPVTPASTMTPVTTLPQLQPVPSAVSPQRGVPTGFTAHAPSNLGYNSLLPAPQALGTQSTLSQGTVIQPGTNMMPPGVSIAAPGTRAAPFPQQQIAQPQTGLLQQQAAQPTGTESTGAMPQAPARTQQVGQVMPQQFVSPQNWQQMPATNPARTATASPTTATIPWR